MGRIFGGVRSHRGVRQSADSPTATAVLAEFTVRALRQLVIISQGFGKRGRR